MKKMWHIYKEILFSHKKEILPFINNIVNLRVSLYQINKPDKERQILYGITYMWNLK